MVGFVSKWYLALGGIGSNQWWVAAVLVLSALLNAAYFLPPLIKAWFEPLSPDMGEKQLATPYETSLMLLMPPLITAASVVIMGLFANAAFSPLAWVRFIVKEYGL